MKDMDLNPITELLLEKTFCDRKEDNIITEAK